MGNFRSKNNPVEWWDSECSDVITDRTSKLKKFQQSRLYTDFIEYKAARAKATKIINTKKKKNFIDFISSINKYTSLTYVWNKMKILKKSFRTIDWNKWQNKDRRQTIINTIEEIADWVEDPRITLDQFEHHSTNNLNNLNNRITEGEVLRAVQNIKKNSSPGLDNIEYKMLKLLPREYITTITYIFNKIFFTGKTPAEWNEHQVIFIDKRDKEKVRPITLSSCFGKLMKRIIAERLIWWVEHDDKLNQKQNGFRRGRSCAENLIEITSTIRTNFFKGRSTLAAFLDISSAYDKFFIVSLSIN